MSDLRKSFLLRCILFVAISICFWVATGAVDYFWNLAWHYLFDRGYPNVIENSIYVYVTSVILWRWLARRVWIASLSAATDANTREDGK